MTIVETDRTRQDDVRPAGRAAVSLSRRHVLRAGYLVLGVGLAVTRWPQLVQHEGPWALADGAVTSMLAALAVLMLLGVRYPLQLLPVLMFELAWKVVWLTGIALPAWTGGAVDAATRQATQDCIWVVIVLVVVPWRYVWRHYVTAAGEPWRPGGAQPAGSRR